VKTAWTNENDPANGSYGIYPVRCTNVLLEDSQAFNASDAGLYVGQSINVVVRRNVARGNVAGLEIENTQYADVYENVVEDNAGGLLVFDLPGNPVIGRDIKIHDNMVLSNNRPNFAPTGTTVSAIPAGTGTFALASRRVEIANNVYSGNDTTDIALLSGLVIQSSTGAWSIPIDMVVGSTVGLVLVETGTAIQNFLTTEIWVHDNQHSGYGTAPDGADPVARELGALLGLLYYFRPNMGPVDAILYDGIGEVVDPAVPGNNTNLNHICVESETGASFAVLDLPKLAAMIAMNDIPSTADIYQPDKPYAPFDCTGFTAGPIPDVMLPF
jgi:parallel beta-helix repeat protein